MARDDWDHTGGNADARNGGQRVVRARSQSSEESGGAPHAVDDKEAVINLARQAVDQEPENSQFLCGLGAALLRAGEFPEAQAQFSKALSKPASENSARAYLHYFRAMTEYELGHQDAAKAELLIASELAAAEQTESLTWNRRLTLELLRNEAEELIGAEEDSATTEQVDKLEKN